MLIFGAVTKSYITRMFKSNSGEPYAGKLHVRFLEEFISNCLIIREGENLLMLRYTRNKFRKESISAKLIEKKEGEYFAIPGKVPSPEAFFELIFMTEVGMKTFEVSVFEYNVVDVGMEGTLVFQGYQLLSFGDWIKEFSV